MTDLHHEAHENAQRNRGNAEKWFDYTGTYDKPQRKERIITEEARKNADTNKGSMKGIMGGYPDPAPQHRLHPRSIRSEASVTAEQNKGGTMKDLMDNYGGKDDTVKPAPKVIGSEAEENAEKNNGVVDNLINNYGNLDLSERPAPKLGHGGDEVAREHNGSSMGPIMRMEAAPSPKETKVSKLHQESESCWDEIPPARRTRPEAEAIIARQAGDSLNGIIHMDGGDQGSSARWEVKTLSHMEESKTPRAKGSPTRTRPEAMEYYERNRGSEMGAIMKMEPSLKNAPRKVNRMFLKSEEW